MLGRRSFLGAAGPLLLLLALLALTSTAQAKSYNQTEKAIKKAKKTATKNGCILGFYAKKQKPWPSSRRNRPISMFTVIKNRGTTPYQQVFLRFYKQPEATLLPTIWSKPEQPNLVPIPDNFILPPPFADPIHYFFLGPMDIQPGTQKIRWQFKLPNCAGPQKFNVTVFPIPNPQIPITCWAQEFTVRAFVFLSVYALCSCSSCAGFVSACSCVSFPFGCSCHGVRACVPAYVLAAAECGSSSHHSLHLPWRSYIHTHLYPHR